MKIQNRDIEFVLEDETQESDPCRYHILRFVRTPPGRLKQLILIAERFDKRGKLIEIDCELNGAKTPQERRKLLSSLVRGSFSTCFEPVTIKVLKDPLLVSVHTAMWGFVTK